MASKCSMKTKSHDHYHNMKAGHENRNSGMDKGPILEKMKLPRAVAPFFIPSVEYIYIFIEYLPPWSCHLPPRETLTKNGCSWVPMLL